MKVDISDVTIFVGVILTIVGAYFISSPFALMTAGGFGIFLGYIMGKAD